MPKRYTHKYTYEKREKHKILKVKVQSKVQSSVYNMPYFANDTSEI